MINLPAFVFQFLQPMFTLPKIIVLNESRITFLVFFKKKKKKKNVFQNNIQTRCRKVIIVCKPASSCHSLEKEMATHSGIPVWTEEPDELKSLGSPEDDLATEQQHTNVKCSSPHKS